MLLNCYMFFFINLKLELLTTLSASGKISFDAYWVHWSSYINYISLRPKAKETNSEDYRSN